MITYRRGTQNDIEQINTLLAQSGLFWPGAAATPYVAENEGRIVGVYFKCLCFHAEPLAIEQSEAGRGVSVTELGKLMYEDMQQLATEVGQTIVVYAAVQNNPKALAAAKKNGMRAQSGTVLHEIVIQPAQMEEAPEELTAGELLPESLIDAPPAM